MNTANGNSNGSHDPDKETLEHRHGVARTHRGTPDTRVDCRAGQGRWSHRHLDGQSIELVPGARR